MAFCFHGLEQLPNPRYGTLVRSSTHGVSHPKVFKLTSERHPRRLPLRTSLAFHGLPCAWPLL